MTQVILTQEQASLVAGASDDIELLDPSGRVVAQLPRLLTPEEFRQAKESARNNQPRVSSAVRKQIMARLEETRQCEGPLGADRAQQIVMEVTSGAPSS